jgi:hypothetical protein
MNNCPQCQQKPVATPAPCPKRVAAGEPSALTNTCRCCPACRAECNEAAQVMYTSQRPIPNRRFVV